MISQVYVFSTAFICNSYGRFEIFTRQQSTRVDLHKTTVSRMSSSQIFCSVLTQQVHVQHLKLKEHLEKEAKLGASSFWLSNPSPCAEQLIAPWIATCCELMQLCSLFCCWLLFVHHVVVCWCFFLIDDWTCKFQSFVYGSDWRFRYILYFP